MGVDFWLGGRIGAWVLDQVEPDRVSRVITFEEAIARRAKELNLRVELGNVNSLGGPYEQTAFSVHYPRVVGKTVLSAYQKTYNLHPGYLPYGRGYYPVFWGLYDGTPMGATLHEMTAGVDQGPIVDQIMVATNEGDTGDTAHRRVTEAEKELFRRWWWPISEGDYPQAHPQSGNGSYHSKADFEALKRGDAWRSMTGEQFLRLVRCLTFDGYPGWSVTLGGQEFELVVKRRDTRTQ